MATQHEVMTQRGKFQDTFTIRLKDRVMATKPEVMAQPGYFQDTIRSKDTKR